MNTDDEKSGRKRSAEITGDEVRSKILAVNPPHSKNNLSNNVSESHLGASASALAKTRSPTRRGVSRLINALKMTFPPLCMCILG